WQQARQSTRFCRVIPCFLISYQKSTILMSVPSCLPTKFRIQQYCRCIRRQVTRNKRLKVLHFFFFCILSKHPFPCTSLINGKCTEISLIILSFFQTF